MISSQLERAIRGKYRFNFNGYINVEDLYDLSVEQLDQVFKALKQSEKASNEESLLDSSTKEDVILRDKIDIVTHIVRTKQAEAEARKLAAERKEKKQRLLEIYSKKQDETYENMDLNALENLINNL